MASRTLAFALELAPYILAPAVSINWVYFGNPAPLTTMNATLAGLALIVLVLVFSTGPADLEL
jgi:hypothetical protein